MTTSEFWFDDARRLTLALLDECVCLFVGHLEIGYAKRFPLVNRHVAEAITQIIKPCFQKFPPCRNRRFSMEKIMLFLSQKGRFDRMYRIYRIKSLGGCFSRYVRLLRLNSKRGAPKFRSSRSHAGRSQVVHQLASWAGARAWMAFSSTMTFSATSLSAENSPITSRHTNCDLLLAFNLQPGLAQFVRQRLCVNRLQKSGPSTE